MKKLWMAHTGEVVEELMSRCTCCQEYTFDVYVQAL